MMSYRETVLSLWPQITSRARRIAAGTGIAADDLEQEGLVAAMSAESKFDPTLGQVEGWILSKAANGMIDYIRANYTGRNGQRVRVNRATLFSALMAEGDPWVGPAAPETASETGSMAFTDLLDGARLGANERTVATMLAEGYDHHECQAAVGLSWHHYVRLMDRLRRRLRLVLRGHADLAAAVVDNPVPRPKPVPAADVFCPEPVTAGTGLFSFGA